jgi:hypothetical protein
VLSPLLLLAATAMTPLAGSPTITASCISCPLHIPDHHHYHGSTVCEGRDTRMRLERGSGSLRASLTHYDRHTKHHHPLGAVPAGTLLHLKASNCSIPFRMSTDSGVVAFSPAMRPKASSHAPARRGSLTGSRDVREGGRE